MPSWKKVVASGSDASFSSLTVDTYVSASSFKGSFTGSLQGTSSWAVSSSNAISSSYALTASYALNGGGGGGISAIYILDEGIVQGTASYFDFTGAGVTATVNNQTASIYIPGGGGGSNTNSQNAILSQTSPAVTWSFTHNLSTLYPVFTIYDNEDNVIIPQKIHAETTSSAFIYFSSARTGTAVASKGGDITSASFAATASLAYNAISASYAYTASSAVSASYAATASSAQNASDILVYVKNSSGAQINKGTVVRIVGAVGDNALIATASYTDDANSANTLGITNETIANDAFGYVMTEGTLLGIDTTAFTAGQLIYLGLNGAITGSSPVAPLHNVRLGEVLRVQLNNGSIYVRVDNGYEIGELHDVRDTTTSGSYGDLLVKSGSIWINSKQLTGSYAITGSLTVTGNITAQTLVVQTVTSSIVYSSGSNIFGNQLTDTQTFTGSVNITGSAVNLKDGAFSGSGANLFGIPATGITGLNLSQISSGSVSASISPNFGLLINTSVSASNFTGSFTGSLAGIATSASYASFALTASYSLGGSGFPYSGSAVITGSFLVSQSFVDFSNASYVTGSLTGSLFGTASYATFALSASFAPGFTTNMSQSIAATTWSFTHNLNTINPIVQVYDLTNSQIIPNQIVGMNNSTAEIRFDYAQAGYAVASNGGGLYVTGSTSTLVQTVGAVTWSFTHNLNNKYNTYEVYDDSDVVIIPSGIKALTNNTAEIYFSGPQTGRVVGQFSGINGSPNAATASYANTASFVSNLNQNVFITGSLTQNSGFVVLTQVSQSLNYVDDVAAAAGGVPLGGIYRNGNFILIRLS